MKLAVTGGSGFIGAHVVDHLRAAGHHVVVIDLRPATLSDGTDHRRVDILDLPALVEAFVGCEVVFHLAGVANVDEAEADPTGTVERNVLGTARVWEAARRAGVRRAVLASTVWVYSAARGEGPFTEDVAFDPAAAAHVYTSSKIAAEMVAQDYQSLYGLDFTILRYGIPFGPGMRPELVISRFVNAALAGEPITVHGDGSQHRNYVYVHDLARAHVLALQDAAANQVFNLEGAESVTVRGLVESIEEVLGTALPASFGDARPGDYGGRQVSAEKAAALLGWRPEVAFRDGLRAFIDSCHARDDAALPAAVSAVAMSTMKPRWLGSLGAAATKAAAVLPILGGVAILLAAGWLLTQAPSATSIFIAAVCLGVGVGFALLRAWAPGTVRRRIPAEQPSARRRVGARFLVSTSAFTVVLGSWVGVTSAHATWFGPVITRAAHSDRDVALTIDAGAGPAAVGVGQQLDAVAVHAAFFTSGREVAAAPDIARQLLRQGHLIGSRAYRGSSAELLDPRSSGLAQAQHLFSERLGICPAFLEPPAGWRTPMLARAVRQRGMAMVTWDVTTEDEGSAAASARAARHILDRVRPGSIINIRLDAATAAGAGSSRLVTEILAGLAHQGLHPVRLDRLLRVPGYSDRC